MSGYKTLISKLRAQLDNIERYNADATAAKAVIQTVWTMGQEVYKYTRETGEAIKSVAGDAGAPRGTFEKFVRFYKLYRDGYRDEINGKPLNWSHYAAVIYVHGREVRDFYIEHAAKYAWSSHELRRRIRSNYYENRIDPQISKRNARGTLKNINQRLYTYGAKVVRVVDADTMYLDIDVGFKTKMEHKVRLRGINAPEKRTSKGDAATAFVKNELMGEGVPATVVIRSYKTSEKFGRYLVDIWYLKGETDKEIILAEGKLLNQVLLDQGLAVKVE